MKLYSVENGYLGNGPTHVLVIAEDEAQALEVARQRLEQGREVRHAGMLLHTYEPSYSDPANLRATLLCADTSRVWVSEVRD